MNHQFAASRPFFTQIGVNYIAGSFNLSIVLYYIILHYVYHMIFHIISYHINIIFIQRKDEPLEIFLIMNKATCACIDPSNIT